LTDFFPSPEKRFQKQLANLDRWLQRREVKRVEAHVARLMREELPADAQIELLLRRSRARLLSARPEEALMDVQEAMESTPTLRERPDVRALLGDVYFSRFELAAAGFSERTDTDHALAEYQSIAELHPGYENIGWVLYQWGRILLSRDQVAEAKEKFHEALFKQTTDPSLTALCYERLGFIELVETRNPEEALVLFSRAVLAYPRGEPRGWLVRLHLMRSRAHREQEQMERAIDAAQEALRCVRLLDSDYRYSLAEINLSVGETLALMTGREREAIDYLTQFLNGTRRPLGIDVTWSRVYENIGDLWFKLERYDQAIEAYQASLTFNPYHPMEVLIQYQVARAYFRQKDYDKTISAIGQMLKAAQNDGNPVTDYRVYSMLASAHFALNQFDEAALHYQQALDLAPPSAEQLDEIRTYLDSAQELSRRRKDEAGRKA
jgi:tetratricopeptide (TPR) repeat protein